MSKKERSPSAKAPAGQRSNSRRRHNPDRRIRSTRGRLGDALVARTALAHNCTLITRNTKDFDWIPDLSLFDPFAAARPS